MLAGKLRHRVTFQRATETQNDFGESEQTFAALDTVWASVEALAGKERYSAMQTKADVDYRVVCRYNSTIASLGVKDRIVWGSITLDIKSVINTDGLNIELQVFAKQHI